MEEHNDCTQHHCLGAHLLLHHEMPNILLFFCFALPWWSLVSLFPLVLLCCPNVWCRLWRCISSSSHLNNCLCIMLPNQICKRYSHCTPYCVSPFPFPLMLFCCTSAPWCLSCDLLLHITVEPFLHPLVFFLVV